MERNKWETAIRCLEIAVHPSTGNDEVIAAVNGFRRTAEAAPLSRICQEYAGSAAPLADLAKYQDGIDRLNRENAELHKKLAAEQAAHSVAARRLDAAYRRVYELTEEALAARRLAEAAQREFEEFRAAYAQLVEGVRDDNSGLRWALDEARRDMAAHPARTAARPFSDFLAEARQAADDAAAVLGDGTGSGAKLPLSA
ncbi:MAG TPA: hypothetical protein VG308_18665 [Stellaceae bacterium]|jgi:chromosome segregation ATPase|nr:hypothetical protein [Stellaceae bacterium]